MHALTCCKDMRHHKQPQRPRGWPGAVAFFKNFECIWTNLYTTPPVASSDRPALVGGAARACATAPGSIPATSTVLQRAPAHAEFYCLQQYFAGDLCHQHFPGILCHQEFFPRRFVSIEWHPNPQLAYTLFALFAFYLIVLPEYSQCFKLPFFHSTNPHLFSREPAQYSSIFHWHDAEKISMAPAQG